jgi:oxalate decarboxylase/phosphoglucose isomerase-like protein (cupin superfamily)
MTNANNDTDFTGDTDTRKEVVIVYEVPSSDFKELLIDDVPIAPGNDGRFRALVRPGKHRLHCRARTRPDEEYEVEILDPEEARWRPDPPRAADPEGIINDFRAFHING